MSQNQFEKSFMNANSIFEVNHDLIKEIETALNKPDLHNILLKGYVQSGKTSTYTYLIAKLFDKNEEAFDGAIIMTKNALDLVETTTKRITQSFEELEDEYTLIDITDEDNVLTISQLKQKKIIVIKKEKSDLAKLKQLIKDNPKLSSQKFLIIDDESDWGSNG